MMRRSWILVLATAAVSGCASTKMHSFVDPEFRGHTYNSLIVSVQLDQLDQRDDAETIFAKRMAGPSIKIVRALDVIPPTRKYNDDEFAEALKRSGCDGLVIVRTTDYYEDEYYVPQSSTTTTTGNLSSNTYYYGNTATTHGSGRATSHTSTHGGYTYKEPRVRHEIQLWDLGTMKMAWIGGTFTKGDRWSGFDRLVSSLADEVETTLAREGLVASAADR